MKPDLLKGIRIVDFTTYVAAPGAGRIMADWGADVIKVEGLTGDPMRNFGLQMGIPATDEVNPIWELENGNKRGITLDLKNPKGMDVMMKLLESADGMTTNVRLGSLKKMGLDYETLAQKFPKLVWGHVSGYGIYGEEAPRPGYDVVSFWARGGFLADTPTIGHPPMTTPFGVGDHTASLVLLGGMLAGIMKAKATGQGEKVVLSLQGTSIWVNGLMALSTQFGDVYPKDRYAPPTPFSNSYQCKDGEWIVLTILQYERYFKAFCEALEIPQYTDDTRYNTLTGIKSNPEYIAQFCHILEDAFAKKDSPYWEERLKAADIAFERATHYHEIATDKQAIANNYVVPFKTRNGTPFMLPMSPVQFKENVPLDNASAPLLGEHNEEVLKELGYGDADIQALRAEKAIL